LARWQVVLSAEDPVVVLCDSDRLPISTTSTPEPVLVVVDRSEQQWDVNSYFVVDQSGQLEFQWFETATEVPLLKESMSSCVRKEFWMKK